MKTGIEIIAEERRRQIEKEGWTSAHDQDHDSCELAFAAATYALPPHTQTRRILKEHLWPWEPRWWKPSDDRIRELAKAGALIAAEIDRLQSIPKP